MPRNSGGVYSIPNTFTPGTKISSANVNSNFSDIATALTGSLPVDGSAAATGVIKFATGSAAAPSIAFSSGSTTGLYYAGSGKVGISGSGSLIILVDPTALGSGQTGAVLTSGTGAVFTPVGALAPFAGATAPAGWILCYGQNISRTSYPELFTVLNAASLPYGSGDGSTTFALPDLRGRVIAGKDDMGGSAASRLTASYFGTSAATLGAVGGLESNTLSISQIPSHDHAVYLKDPGHDHDFIASRSNTTAQGVVSITVGTAVSTGQTTTEFTGITIGSVNGVANDNKTASAGSNTAHNNMQPTIILNWIIFAGR